jgi:hypothetical protein
METTSPTLQPGKVDVDGQVGSFPSDGRCFRAFQKGSGEIPQSVGTTLAGRPLVVSGGGWHQAVNGGE